MRLTKLEIEGFRSLRHVVWEPGSLNVLIGPNAGGKSNLVKSLEFMKQCALGTLPDFVQKEGGVNRVIFDAKAPQMRCKGDFEDSPHLSFNLLRSEKSPLSYEIRILESSMFAYEIDSEQLRCEQELLFSRGRYNAQAWNGIEFVEESTISPEDPLLSSATSAFFPDYASGKFAESVAKWGIYRHLRVDRSAPVRNLSIVPQKETLVSDDGSNLINVLYTYYANDEGFRQQSHDLLAAAYVDTFEDLIFPVGPDGRQQCHIKWRSLDRTQTIADISDGTVRLLWLLAIFGTPDPPELIVIDEPEIGFHPGMFPVLAELIHSVTNRSQVIVATHSPDLLSALQRYEPITTVVELKNGETQLKNLGGEELQYWLKEYSLGDLFLSGQLESME